MSKISHYKPETGYKAYSYCGTICKNYLLWKINQYNKNLKRNDSFEDNANEISNDIKYSYEGQKDTEGYLQTLFKEIARTINEMMQNPTAYKLKEEDLRVGTALVTIFQDWETLFARMGTNKFNKSSIILFIQETTLLTAKEVKSSINKYKGAYKN